MKSTSAAAGDIWLHQVCQKDETSLQQPQHEEFPVGIRRRDLLAKLVHATRDIRLSECNTPDRPSRQARVGRTGGGRGGIHTIEYSGYSGTRARTTKVDAVRSTAAPPGERDCPSGTRRTGERNEPLGAAPVEGHAGARRDRRPEDRERLGRQPGERVRRHDQRRQQREAKGVDDALDRRAPVRGAPREREHFVAESGSRAFERGEQVQPDPVALMGAIEIRRIVHESDLVGLGVAQDVGPPDVDEGARDRRSRYIAARPRAELLRGSRITRTLTIVSS